MAKQTNQLRSVVIVLMCGVFFLTLGVSGYTREQSFIFLIQIIAGIVVIGASLYRLFSLKK